MWFNTDTNLGIGCASAHTNTITINVKNMIEYTEKHNTTFSNIFAQTVSHELIHLIIYVWTDDINKSHGLDIFCIQKYDEIKHWIGGVGATKEGEQL